MMFCASVLSRFNRVQLCNSINCSLPGSSVHGDSPGKNTGECSHALLQGIYITQGSNPCLLCLLHWQVGSLPLAPPTACTLLPTVHELAHACPRTCVPLCPCVPHSNSSRITVLSMRSFTVFKALSHPLSSQLSQNLNKGGREAVVTSTLYRKESCDQRS